MKKTLVVLLSLACFGIAACSTAHNRHGGCGCMKEAAQSCGKCKSDKAGCACKGECKNKDCKCVDGQKCQNCKAAAQTPKVQ